MSALARTAAVVIPARLGSGRFPRKVLADATGKFLVQHVWERVVGCPGVSRVVIATDSDEVLEACRSFGADVRMTSVEHRSGTDRVAEVAADLDDEIIVNIQGDEPLITHDDVMRLVGLFDRASGREPSDGESAVVMTTLVAPRGDIDGFRDPNIVKAVLAADGRAVYFSRAPVPWTDAAGLDDAGVSWWQHIGVYAYRREFLLHYASLPPTELESRERLEQLRALEGGYVIRAAVASGEHLGIDTPEEYERFVAAQAEQKGDRAGCSR